MLKASGLRALLLMALGLNFGGLGAQFWRVWGFIWEGFGTCLGVLGPILEVWRLMLGMLRAKRLPKRGQEATKTDLDEFGGARDPEKVSQVETLFGTCSMCFA